jgi:hypothetical protein
MGTKKTRGKKPGSPSGASKSSLKAIHISKYGHRNITYQIDHGEQHLATRPRRCDVDGEASRQHIDGQGAKQRRRPRRHDKMMLVKMTWRMVNTYINIYLYIYIMMMIWWMIWYMFFNGDMVNDMAIPYRTHCLRKEGGVQLYWPTSGEG